MQSFWKTYEDVSTAQADLIRCGFSEGQAKAAARRCSSIEAAVVPWTKDYDSQRSKTFQNNYITG